MNGPETLDERLAKCVKPLKWEWVPERETYSAYCEASDQLFYATGDTRHICQEQRTARILAALDMDAIARLVAEAVEKEREGCARIAWESEDVYGARNMQDMAKCARNIAAAIRARSEGGA